MQRLPLGLHIFGSSQQCGCDIIAPPAMKREARMHSSILVLMSTRSQTRIRRENDSAVVRVRVFTKCPNTHAHRYSHLEVRRAEPAESRTHAHGQFDK